jgi:hypothetical protein
MCTSFLQCFCFSEFSRAKRECQLSTKLNVPPPRPFERQSQVVATRGSATTRRSRRPSRSATASVGTPYNVNPEDP